MEDGRIWIEIKTITKGEKQQLVKKLSWILVKLYLTHQKIMNCTRQLPGFWALKEKCSIAAKVLIGQPLKLLHLDHF